MSERSSEQYPIIENQVVRIENPQEEEEPEETDNDDESLGNDSRSSRQLLQDGVYEFFSYEHPHDKSGEFYYSAVKNYLHCSKKTAVVFAMGIGHEFFEAMIGKPPFTTPKKQEHIKTITPIKSVLSDEVIRRGYIAR
jgi:hypothetical protein